jgi:hypothetical protein
MSFLNDFIDDRGAVAMLSRGQMVKDGSGASTRNMVAPFGRRGRGRGVVAAIADSRNRSRDGSRPMAGSGGRGRRGMAGRMLDILGRRK